jgi:hypothetical protein
MSNVQERWIVAEGRSDIPPVRVVCEKHKAPGESISADQSKCPYCIEDARILDEKVQRVAAMMSQNEITRTGIVDALRDLIREVRR